MSQRRLSLTLIILISLLLLLIVGNFVFGAVNIPVEDVINILAGGEGDKETWRTIILESRLPMIITAALSGAALSVAGLLLQTVFNNPLAGPSILGVSTGASLGVAIVMLSVGTGFGTALGITHSGFWGILVGAFIGAFAVLITLLIFSAFVRSTVMLLIIGILVSYLTSSAISLLNFFSTQEGVHSYMIWGLGSFNGLTLDQIPLFAIVVLIALVWSVFMVKPLNAMLLGSRYATNLGVNVKNVRNQLLVITGLLTAVVTAFCGPISFVGLVVPHIARLMLNTSNHNSLLPVTMLSGAVIALLCTLISVLPTNGTLPVNAITPIIGVPVIIYIILNRRKIQYFN